ncbi:hypothetical protein CERSUDRAFT_101657 [Gelatoporia subvermispora B]|uniref:Uncharacterized protein n=1 Tax=Ceriporiopsis subvermispora (strain B) TaxID=914234 RepID=M2P4Y7_CERS8|nr:hypothetical protein CERSUDRAFT_101657 [Gelatoporia subvermispora B]
MNRKAGPERRPVHRSREPLVSAQSQDAKAFESIFLWLQRSAWRNFGIEWEGRS